MAGNNAERLRNGNLFQHFGPSDVKLLQIDNHFSLEALDVADGPEIVAILQLFSGMPMCKPILLLFCNFYGLLRPM